MPTIGVEVEGVCNGTEGDAAFVTVTHYLNCYSYCELESPNSRVGVGGVGVEGMMTLNKVGLLV